MYVNYTIYIPLCISWKLPSQPDTPHQLAIYAAHHAHFTIVVFLSTTSLVLNLLVLLRDLQVVFHLAGIGATLKFCAGFAPG